MQLNKILVSAYEVAQFSKYVRIDKEALKNFSNIILEESNYWINQSPYGILDLSYTELVNLLFIYHAIGSFCFWGNPKWTIRTDDNENIDGSFAFLYILLSKAKTGCFSNLNNIKHVTYGEFCDLLKGNVEIPFLKERYQFFCEIIEFAINRYDGDFTSLVNSVQTDNEFFDAIKDLNCFKDIRTYNGKIIPFYKRIQLVISDIAIVQKIKKGRHIYTIDNLVGCADYKLPQVLREYGVLIYNKELSNIIDNNKQINENDEKEIEIRASTLVVINELNKNLHRNSMIVNDQIWMLSQVKKCSKPYHLTRTTSY